MRKSIVSSIKNSPNKAIEFILIQNYGYGLFIKDYYYGAPIGANGLLVKQDEAAWQAARSQ
jgi:hypothetical protein